MKTRKIIKHVAVAISLGVLLAPMAASGGGFGKKQASRPVQGTLMAETLASLPYEELSEAEINGLTQMREEEKLARDVYQYLNSEWGLVIFQKISESEQRHMDSIKVLLDKYGLADPTENNASGAFTSQEMQDLHDELIAYGSESQIAALEVGATIEDLDIKYLQNLLTETDNSDIQIAYQNLMQGSRNHLRSFVYQLSLTGVEYEAQYLSPEEIESIILSPFERGMYNQDGEVENESGIRLGTGGGINFIDADGNGVCDLYEDLNSL